MLFELRQNGISLAPEEPMVEDQWQKSYKLRKSIERGEMPLSRAAVDASRWHRLELACAKAKHLAKYMSGAPHVDMKLTQFALNERKVLRFKAYWDDHTPQPDRSHVMSLNNGSFLEEHHLPSTDFMLFQWFSDVFSFVRGVYLRTPARIEVDALEVRLQGLLHRPLLPGGQLGGDQRSSVPQLGPRRLPDVHEAGAAEQDEPGAGGARPVGRRGADLLPRGLPGGRLHQCVGTEAGDLRLPPGWQGRRRVRRGDDATQRFYQAYMGIDQRQGCIDVSEKPVKHLKFTPPPHNGVGREEDDETP